MTSTVHVELPAHLRQLAACPHTLELLVQAPVTTRTILDALEAAHPALRGTIRDQTTGARRAFIRFFACEQDLSHLSPDEELPQAVATAKEPFLIIGAISGG